MTDERVDDTDFAFAAKFSDVKDLPDETKGEGAYRTISEVADEVGVPQHVLRFWETRFSAIRPLKRGGNRRYYRPDDVVLLHIINRLLYSEGYTIRGVQKLLRLHGPRGLVRKSGGEESLSAATENRPDLTPDTLPEQEDADLGPLAVIRAELLKLRTQLLQTLELAPDLTAMPDITAIAGR